MHHAKDAGKRFVSFVLALIMVLGILPITPAMAVTNSGNGIINAIEQSGKSVQNMKMSQIKNPVLYNSKGNKSVSDWFATFTDSAGNKGFGYCNDHTKPAPNNGAGASMTITASSYGDNVALKDLLFVGYDGSRRTANFALKDLRSWVSTIYGSDKTSNWDGLTDGEFQKATQLAFWMLAWGTGTGKAQVSIEGQYGTGVGNCDIPTAFEYFKNSNNQGASAQRVLSVAKGLFGYATWLANQGYDFEKNNHPELKVHPLYAQQFTEGRGYWDGSTQTLDFTKAKDTGDGTLEDAYKDLGEPFIRDDGEFYTIDYMLVSGTQWAVDTGSTYVQNVTPNGVKIEGYMGDAQPLLDAGVDPGYAQAAADAPDNQTWYSLFMDADGANGLRDDDPHSTEKPYPDGTASRETCYVRYFKVKIPKSLAKDPNKVTFDIYSKVYAYRVFLAEAGAQYQGFGIAATTQDLVNKSVINWDKPLITPPVSGPPESQPPGSGDDTVLRKYSADGRPLAGAVFEFEQVDGDEKARFTTDSTGAITINWTNPAKENYVKPGSYMVTEKVPPYGYNLDDTGSQPLELRPDGTHSGQLIFTNTRRPTIEIYKVSADGTPLPGAWFKVWKDGKYLGEIGPSTDPQGKIEFQGVPDENGVAPGLENGYYEFQEYRAPSGFLLSEEKKGIHVDLSTLTGSTSMLVNTLTFTNYEWPKIRIIKQDKETGDKLAGATFNVRINGQDFESQMVTDESGTIEITYEQYKKFLEVEDPKDGWTVTVTEIKAPDLYNKDLQEGGTYTLTQKLIKGQSEIIFTFEDTHYKDLTVYKRDEETNWLLKGATFELHCVARDDGDAGNVEDRTLTTDETGKVVFEDLPNGTYTVKEISPPPGYHGTDEVKTIVINSDTKVLELTFKNTPKSGLLIRKIDSVTKQPIPNVQFRVTPLAPLTGQSKDYFTNDNGVIVIENLEAGSYNIQEISTVDGYVLNEEIKTVQIDAEHDAYTVTYENNAENMLYILKQDAITHEALAGAMFEITTAGGTHIANVTTGIYGYATVPNLKPGSYVVKEIKAPDGHIIDPTPQTFEIPENASGWIKTLIFDNSPYTNLYIRKYDALTGIGLEGAHFKVWKDNTLIADDVASDAAGYIHIGEQTEGMFQVQEIRAPKGYTLNDKIFTMYLKDGETGTLEIPNNKPGGVAVRKVDAKTGAALKGATFELRTIEGTLIGSKTTTNDGYVRWEQIEPGWYVITETKAPEGYSRDTKPRNIEIKEFESLEIEWENNQDASLTVIKRDKDSSVPLADATFEIRTMEGAVVETITTDSTGTATSGRIEPGWYRVVETRAPEGYLLDKEEHLVKITADTPVTIDVYNVMRKGITIHKVDAITRDPLAGAVIEVRTVDNKLVESYTTDGSGTITTKALDPGFYLIVETKAPDGYVLDKTPQTVEMKEGQQSVVTVENMPETIIQVYKTDVTNGNPLRYAEFEIIRYSDNQSLGFMTTDETGWAHSQTLAPGEYIVKETKAPKGYALDPTEHRVTVVDGKNAILRLTNAPETSLHISKIDKVTRKPLAGAEFELRYDTGHGDCTYIGTYITDENGMIHTEPLTPGFYMIKETHAPDGYDILKEEVRYCVKAGEYNQVVIENVPMGTLIVRKIDSKTGEPIAGAVFKVENADRSDLIGLKETDANGEAIFTGLKEGFYLVTETQAPPGYVISSCGPQTIHVEYGKNNYCDFKDAAKGSLVIVLQDLYTDEYLYGGRFVVTRESDQTVIFDGSTDTTGTIVVGNLIPGWYTVTQEFPPDKYTIHDKTTKVEILVGTQQTVYFKDYTAGLVIEKVDAKYPELLLEGARFQVKRDSDGIVIGEYVTGKDGLALVDGLTDGLYTITELVAPQGYSLDAEPQKVHVRAGTEAHATFLDTRMSSITIKTLDANQKPVPGVVVEVWEQNGVLVNTYTSDSTGVIQTDHLPAGHYVLKVVSVPDGYSVNISTGMQTTVELVDGIETTFKFEFAAKGVLKIMSTNSADQAIAGMHVTVTKIDGTKVGEYTTGKDGSVLVDTLETGWYIVTETKAPDGYTLPETVEQRVEIKSGAQASVTFRHAKVFGLQIITTCRQSKDKIAGAVYEITKLDGAKVGTYTSDDSGIAFAALEPGWYIVKPVSVPDGYTMEDEKPRNVEVKGDGMTSVEFFVNQMSSIRVKVVDGTTKKPIYNVRLQLKNGSNCIKEFYTNNEGTITIDKELLNGDYTLEMISAPDGYTVDTIPKSIKVLVAETTEITWAIYQGGGQIQVTVKSADYNKTLDKAAGTGLQGAVFEITNADTYQVVGQMISDVRGVAASSGLPIGRYTVKMITAPAYYAVNSDWNPEVRIKINNDVVPIDVTVKSVNLASSITVKSNTTIKAGSNMRVDVTAAANGSDVRLDNFFLHIKVPTDAARAINISTGTWSHAVFYKIMYKTNMNDYRPLATNLQSTNAYQYGLSTQALGLQSGEYLTDIRFEFGTVPAGFKMVKKMAYGQYVLATVPNGHKLISRVELGGQHNTTIVSTNHIDNDQPYSTSGSTVIVGAGNEGSYGGTGTPAISGNSGQWTTSSGLWTTTVKNTSIPSRLPTTGY